jgi:CRISPR-associated protein Cas2
MIKIILKLSDGGRLSRLKPMRMVWLVAYDIRDDKTRNKVSKVLSKYGFRIQYSVYYLPSVSERDVELLKLTIRSMVNRKTDRVFFYPLEGFPTFLGYPIEPVDLEVL